MHYIRRRYDDDDDDDIYIRMLGSGATADQYVRLHSELSREEQVVALIHQDACINCGECYVHDLQRWAVDQ